MPVDPAAAPQREPNVSRREPTDQPLPPAILFHSSTVAWTILAVSLVLTGVAWYLSHLYIKNRARDRFGFRVTEVREAVSRRMIEYEQVLRGGIGLYVASRDVSRREWQTYIANTQLLRYYPGIQGVGVSKFVSPDQKQSFVENIRAQGFPEFEIRPPGDREIYSAIVFLEPFDWRNQRAFGYDMYSQPTRRAAMDQAITTGEPAISAMVTLVQETDTDQQTGFLVYLPLYQPGLPTETTEQRKFAALGFVYAPFRVADLMTGILKSGVPDIDFQIFDADQISPTRLMYDSNNDPHFDYQNSTADFKTTETLNLHGRIWTLHFQSQSGFISGGESYLSLMVGSIGLLVDLLLFLVIGSIGRQQRMATKLATEMTAAYRRTEQQFKAVCDTAYDPIVLVDRNLQILYVNPAAERAFGYESATFVEHNLAKLFCSDTPVFLNSSKPDFGVDGDRGETESLTCITRDGREFPASVSMSTWTDQGGQFMAVVIRDITERRAKGEIIRQKMGELQRSNRDLDDFAYIASHDLRSPLRGVEHLAAWIVEDAAELLPEESRNHLAMLSERISFMQSLLTDLLTYSRVGKVSERVASVNATEMVKEIVAVLVKPPTLNIVVDQLPTFTTLRTPLETCLRNLIDNAIKHHDREEGTVTISAHRDDDFIHFTVADDGPGIPQRAQQRIFKIFQTLQPKNERRSGSGIGLSIIKKTVETYGGTIAVESEPGRGSRFTLSIPKRIKHSSNSPPTDSEKFSQHR